MKPASAIITSSKNNWSNHSKILVRLFSYLTGYDIMFEDSRKDLVPEKGEWIIKNEKQDYVNFK